MIRHLLIAISEDGMDASAVAAHAGELAAGVGADVTLFRAYSEPEFDDWLEEMGYDSAPPEEMARRNSAVGEAADVLQEMGVELTVAAEVGDPATAISKYVADHDIDHVFLGTRRRSRAGKAILGSISQEVMLSLDVPCTVMTGN